MRKNSVLGYHEFHDFLQKEIEKNTHLKRGEKKSIAKYLNIHPTLLSQIFSKNREFTPEQVFLLCDYLGLSELEGDYVALLHQISITQNKKFKENLLRKSEKIKNRSLNLSERVEKDKELTNEEKSIYYTSWQYSAIRMLSSLKGGKMRDEISERLGIDKKQVTEILEFLVNAGLCKAEKGRYFQSIGRTHLEKTSPYLKQHHTNWRIKSIQKMDCTLPTDLSFTAPLSLSNKDFDFLREEIVKLIK